jgi:hypothetical protein
MIAQRNSIEHNNPPSEWQHLAHENRSLREIVAKLLIENQNLRWQLLRHTSIS